MKTLETTFKKYGYEFEMLKRNNVAAIFAQKSGSAAIAHEVVLIQNLPTRYIREKEIEAGEYYPSTEMWGSKGWTCSTLAKAEAKFQFITERELAK